MKSIIEHIRNLRNFAATQRHIPGDIEVSCAAITAEFGERGDVHRANQRSGRAVDAVTGQPVNAISSHESLHDAVFIDDLHQVYLSANRVMSYQENARQAPLSYIGRNEGREERGMLIPEELILSMAHTIEHQRSRSAQDTLIVDNLQEGKNVYGNKQDEKTDASKEFCDEHHYDNWSDVAASLSSISMTVASSTGTYLNGSATKHQYFVSMKINNPNGQSIAEVNMSFEQFASLLVRRGEVPCTMAHYYSVGESTVALREVVRNPESIVKRMEQRLNDAAKKRCVDFDAILDQLQSSDKPMGKKDREEFVRSLKRVRESMVNTNAFIALQAMEEGSSLMEASVAQVLMAQSHADRQTGVVSILESLGVTPKLGHSPSNNS